MKKLINQLLPVTIDYPIEQIQRIEFVFNQGGRNLRTVEYPSSEVTVTEEGVFLIRFMIEDTLLFSPSFVRMDTRITLTDSIYQPETSIAVFDLKETLFTG